MINLNIYYENILALVAFFCVLLIVVICLYISNIFAKISDITIRTGRPCFGTIYITYKFHKSDYTNVPRLVQDIKSISKQSKNEIIVIYYDNPKRTKSGKQRFIVGTILNDQNMNTNRKLEEEFKQHGYNFICVSQINYAVLSQFPWTNKFSNLIAIKKVYPKIKEFIKKNKLCAYPYIELHSKQIIHIVIPLCEQAKFFVQEYHDSIRSDSNSKKYMNISRKEE